MPIHPLADESAHAALSHLISFGRREGSPGVPDDDIGKSHIIGGLELERVHWRGAAVFGPFGGFAQAGDGGGAKVALVEGEVEQGIHGEVCRQSMDLRRPRMGLIEDLVLMGVSQTKSGCACCDRLDRDGGPEYSDMTSKYFGQVILSLLGRIPPFLDFIFIRQEIHV